MSDSWAFGILGAVAVGVSVAAIAFNLWHHGDPRRQWWRSLASWALLAVVSLGIWLIARAQISH